MRLLRHSLQEEPGDAVGVGRGANLGHVRGHVLHDSVHGAAGGQARLLAPTHAVGQGEYGAVFEGEDPEHVRYGVPHDPLGGPVPRGQGLVKGEGYSVGELGGHVPVVASRHAFPGGPVLSVEV